MTLAGSLAALAVALALPVAAHAPAHAPAPTPAHTPAPRPAAPPAPVPPRPEDSVRAAYEAAIAPGLADSSQARLTRFLAAHGHSPWAYSAELELGQLHYARGEYAAARDHFRRAHGGASLDEARWWEGLSAFALGRPQDAREAVSALAHERRGAPRQWDAANLVALSWAQQGNEPAALAAYRQLLALPRGTGEAAALYQAQKLAHDLAHTEDAAAWGRRLLAEYPESPEAASLRAELARGARDAAASAASKSATGPGPGAAPAVPPTGPAKGGR